MMCGHKSCWAVGGLVIFVIGLAWLLDSINYKVLGWQWQSYLGLLVTLGGLMKLYAGLTGHGMEGWGSSKKR